MGAIDDVAPRRRDWRPVIAPSKPYPSGCRTRHEVNIGYHPRRVRRDANLRYGPGPGYPASQRHPRGYVCVTVIASRTAPEGTIGWIVGSALRGL